MRAAERSQSAWNCSKEERKLFGKELKALQIAVQIAVEIVSWRERWGCTRALLLFVDYCRNRMRAVAAG